MRKPAVGHPRSVVSDRAGRPGTRRTSATAMHARVSAPRTPHRRSVKAWLVDVPQGDAWPPQSDLMVGSALRLLRRARRLGCVVVQLRTVKNRIEGRGNIVATVRSSDVSDASGIPDDLDDSDAGGRISRLCTRLRALWASRPVVVRVHSSAWHEGPENRAFSASARRSARSQLPSRRLTHCDRGRSGRGITAAAAGSLGTAEQAEAHAVLVDSTCCAHASEPTACARDPLHTQRAPGADA